MLLNFFQSSMTQILPVSKLGKVIAVNRSHDSPRPTAFLLLTDLVRCLISLFSCAAAGSASAAATLTSKVLQPGYEQLDSVPKGGSRFMKKRAARLERAKTSGAGWFNMRAPEMTEEVKQNLEVLQMRSAIDKNRVYKKNDMRVLPKYFQMGTVVESAADFYSGRIPKKQRRKTLVEELMADVEAKKQLKKKAAKAAVKKQLKKQKPFPKKKSSKMRNRDMD